MPDASILYPVFLLLRNVKYLICLKQNTKTKYCCVKTEGTYNNYYLPTVETTEKNKMIKY